MGKQRDRAAFTLIELLVVVAIIGVLIGLASAAVMRARQAAVRAKCQNNMRQIGLALHQAHDANGHFPTGHHSRFSGTGPPYTGWTLAILPYLEQVALSNEAWTAFGRTAWPFVNPPHVHLATVVPAFVCPADSRLFHPQKAARSGYPVAFTSYLGVEGRDHRSRDGVLYQNSKTRLADIADGASNTLMAGERPPSPDFQFGWWYAGYGQLGTGSGDLTLGVRAVNLQPVTAASACGPGVYAYRDSRLDDPCGAFRFWSLHPGGANFLLADGGVRFIGYDANPMMPALASRAGGETVPVP